MSEGKLVERTIHYSYPKDCGRFILFPEGKKPQGKPIDKLHYKCRWSSQWSCGGRLNVRDANSGESEEDDDDDEEGEEEEENINSCKLSMKLYNKKQWHVYFTVLGCGWYNARLLGLFDDEEGAEIFTRILSDNHSGNGIYHKNERVTIDVSYDNEEEGLGIEVPWDDGEAFGSYLWIVSYNIPFKFTHSLNCSDDWDQDCRTDTDIRIPPPKLTKKKKKDKKKDKKKEKKSKRKEKKKSMNEKKPKKSSKK